MGNIHGKPSKDTEEKGSNQGLPKALCSDFCGKTSANHCLHYQSEMSHFKREKKKHADGLSAHKVAFSQLPIRRAAAREERQEGPQNQEHSLSAAVTKLSEYSL